MMDVSQLPVNCSRRSKFVFENPDKRLVILYSGNTCYIMPRVSIEFTARIPDQESSTPSFAFSARADRRCGNKIQPEELRTMYHRSV